MTKNNYYIKDDTGDQMKNNTQVIKCGRIYKSKTAAGVILNIEGECLTKCDSSLHNWLEAARKGMEVGMEKEPGMDFWSAHMCSDVVSTTG